MEKSLVLFYDRDEAGEKLGNVLLPQEFENPIILSVPFGGIPVGARIARKLRADFDLIFVRKIPIPYEPEAGFGAISPDGVVHLNKDMLAHLNLSDREITIQIDRIWDELQRRKEILQKKELEPDIEGKTVILVDDGLATGYTMLAGADWIKLKRPKRLIIASPVATNSAANLLKPLADEVITLYRHPDGLAFAVASFYKKWKDLTAEEVLPYLSQNKG